MAITNSPGRRRRLAATIFSPRDNPTLPLPPSRGAVIQAVRVDSPLSRQPQWPRPRPIGILAAAVSSRRSRAPPSLPSIPGSVDPMRRSADALDCKACANERLWQGHQGERIGVVESAGSSLIEFKEIFTKERAAL
uniref:Uncharacterized protein n=1 Tax=Leersia perrieri TaxID=77586 RepID=A0A0D9XR03_9ORYZ